MSTFSIYQFISNHSKSISLIIILGLTIIITLHVYNSHSKKEGAGDILQMIKCPMKIFENLGTCLNYWLIDILFYVIYYINYGICYFFFLIFTALYMALSAILPTITKKSLQDWGVYPSKPSVKGMCPTREWIMNAYESFHSLFSSKRFAYRGNKDIQKCYCSRSLIKAFKPLQNYKPFTMNSSSLPSLGIYSLIFAISIYIIIIVLYILGKGLKEMIQTFRQTTPVVGVLIPDSQKV